MRLRNEALAGALPTEVCQKVSAPPRRIAHTRVDYVEINKLDQSRRARPEPEACHGAARHSAAKADRATFGNCEAPHSPWRCSAPGPPRAPRKRGARLKMSAGARNHRAASPRASDARATANRRTPAVRHQHRTAHGVGAWIRSRARGSLKCSSATTLGPLHDAGSMVSSARVSNTARAAPSPSSRLTGRPPAGVP